MAFDLAAIKRSFFTSLEVMEAADRGTIAALSRMGAFVRRKQKSLIRYRKKASAPGQPPSAHRSKGFTRQVKRKGVTKSQQSSPLRELIFFGYDTRSRSVVSGPAKFDRSRGGSIPETLEEGGEATILVPVPRAKRAAGVTSQRQKDAYLRLLAEGRIERKQPDFYKRRFRIAPRPSAKPAMDAEMPKFASCFKDRFKKRR